MLKHASREGGDRILATIGLGGAVELLDRDGHTAAVLDVGHARVEAHHARRKKRLTHLVHHRNVAQAFSLVGDEVVFVTPDIVRQNRGASRARDFDSLAILKIELVPFDCEVHGRARLPAALE